MVGEKQLLDAMSLQSGLYPSQRPSSTLLPAVTALPISAGLYNGNDAGLLTGSGVGLHNGSDSGVFAGTESVTYAGSGGVYAGSSMQGTATIAQRDIAQHLDTQRAAFAGQLSDWAAEWSGGEGRDAHSWLQREVKKATTQIAKLQVRPLTAM